MSVPQRLDSLHKYLLSLFYHKNMCVVPINTSTLRGGSRKEMVMGAVEGEDSSSSSLAVG